jgi:hypothetical protein
MGIIEKVMLGSVSPPVRRSMSCDMVGEPPRMVWVAVVRLASVEQPVAGS